jgi:hypothetical protein
MASLEWNKKPEFFFFSFAPCFFKSQVFVIVTPVFGVTMITHVTQLIINASQPPGMIDNFCRFKKVFRQCAVAPAWYKVLQKWKTMSSR